MSKDNRALVLDSNREPLMPAHPARARRLLKEGRASVFRRYPFTIILHDREGGGVAQTAFKIDPGSKTTGIALVADFARRGATVIWAGELHHRGEQVKRSMDARRQQRKSRRSRKARYRKPRFNNRGRPKGWLPPSLAHRVETTMTWVERMRRFSPVSSFSMELARFDTQKMESPEISGVAYQQGELAGYELREYLLEKWGRLCAYCDEENVPLQIDHIHPRARGGSDRASNLTLACLGCNDHKGKRPIEEFLAKDPVRLQRVLAAAKAPLKDAATVNATRWALYRRLAATVLPVEIGTGGRTKYNRSLGGYPKRHWIDAASVGGSGESVRLHPGMKALSITSNGHGSRQMVVTDRNGFPVKHRTSKRTFMGFRTGDMVRAVIPRGKHRGTHTGRVAIRQRPRFRLGKIEVHPKYLRLIHRADGYEHG